MKLTPQNKYKIDQMSLQDLEIQWRHHIPGNLWLSGETGKYWQQRMRELKIQEIQYV